MSVKDVVVSPSVDTNLVDNIFSTHRIKEVEFPSVARESSIASVVGGGVLNLEKKRIESVAYADDAVVILKGIKNRFIHKKIQTEGARN
uniref:Uncharacterized protein n=1 Tax=Megaselia scalaris TaxID=36166 RepID=T1GFS1_MEGSC